MALLNRILLTALVTACVYGASAQRIKTTTAGPDRIPAREVIPGLSDEQLLDEVQRQTFRYFWDFAHPVSGMARERSNRAYDYGDEVVTTGGTGFGVMAVIVATERGWISRDSAARHLLKMVRFLSKADAFHGVFPHWLNGSTGKTIPVQP